MHNYIFVSGGWSMLLFLKFRVTQFLNEPHYQYLANYVFPAGRTSF